MWEKPGGVTHVGLMGSQELPRWLHCDVSCGCREGRVLPRHRDGVGLKVVSEMVEDRPGFALLWCFPFLSPVPWHDPALLADVGREV